MNDSHPGVRRIGWKLAEKDFPFESSASQLQLQPEIIAKEDIPVLMQMAWSIGTWQNERVGNYLADILLAHPTDEHLQTAVLSAIRPIHHSAFIHRVVDAAHQGKISSTFIRHLLPVLAEGDTNRAVKLLEIVTKPSSKGYTPWQFGALGSSSSLLSASLPSSLTEQLEELFLAAHKMALDSQQPEADRLSAATLLAASDYSEPLLHRSKEVLLKLLKPTEVVALQQEALMQLARVMDDETLKKILDSWSTFSLGIRSRLLDVLLSKNGWQKILLDYVSHGKIPSNQLDASSKQRLLTSRDAKIRSTAENCFERIHEDRAAIFQAYMQAMNTKGNPERGKIIFLQSCAACHQLGKDGHAVGPDLTALVNRQPAFLLQEILDPNRNLDSRYVEYVAVTHNGRTITGLLTSEAGSSITLKGKVGISETLLRSEIEELHSTNKSLMPEGLEKEISPSDMNDLIAYLGSMRQSYKRLAGNSPVDIIRPVNSVHTLLASEAEIYGNAITFENDYQNIGYWHGLEDHVCWNIDIPSKGDYDIYFDWACDNSSAGNQYLLDIGGVLIQKEVAGTGGWDKYLRVRVAQAVPLHPGVQRLKLSPASPPAGALMDLRAIYIAPAEFRLNLQEGTAREKPDLIVIAKQFLDDKLPERERQKLVEQHWQQAPELIVAMTTNMPDDIKEEYRRIPWIWRVAIFASKKNDSLLLSRLLDISMPKVEEPLKDWQAVVIGGGIINGIGLL
ncbi:MAG TPA: c-type cytochrome, partial [Gemmatales bacterium]|nr:c-type cytochrome [Gemmatales bacterium]